MAFRSKTEEGHKTELLSVLTENERNPYARSSKPKSSNGKTATQLYANPMPNKLKNSNDLKSILRSYRCTCRR